MKRFYCFALILVAPILLNIAAQSQTLSIPFYDDFSEPGLLTPDSTLWLPSGVTLNNSYAINPPTQFVATFDGRDQFGQPYDGSTNNSFGEADSLVSRPIDLSGYTADSILTLSFFLQPKGLGDLPDAEDEFIVRFKNRDLEWEDVWENDSIKNTTEFQQAFIEIIEERFLHNQFQFAFVSKGRQSGPFDAWHLDYIFLQTKEQRFPQQGFYEDISVQSIKGSILKYYRSMPMRQFRANADNEISETLTANIRNLRPVFFGAATASKWVLNESTTGANIFTVKSTTAPVLDSVSANDFRVPRFTVPDSDKAILSYGFVLVESSDSLSVFANGVDFRRNDSLFITSELDDFYAYDDGTAEVGADVDLQLGSVAIQFILNQPDTLGAIRINFTPYFSDQTGENFLLRVFSNKNGKPDTELTQETVEVKYPTLLNGFVEYELSKSIAVSDTFYVGWSRLTEQSIPVGFDKNSPEFSDRIFYNLGAGWLTNRSPSGTNRINGSFMLRPVMGFKRNGTDSTSNKPLAVEPIYNNDIIVFPNPATKRINWKKQGEFTAQILEMNGRVIIEKITSEGFLETAKLPAGSYLLRLSNPKEVYSKKVIIIN